MAIERVRTIWTPSIFQPLGGASHEVWGGRATSHRNRNLSWRLGQTSQCVIRCDLYDRNDCVILCVSVTTLENTWNMFVVLSLRNRNLGFDTQKRKIYDEKWSHLCAMLQPPRQPLTRPNRRDDSGGDDFFVFWNFVAWKPAPKMGILKVDCNRMGHHSQDVPNMVTPVAASLKEARRDFKPFFQPLLIRFRVARARGFEAPSPGPWFLPLVFYW